MAMSIKPNESLTLTAVFSQKKGDQQGKKHLHLAKGFNISDMLKAHGTEPAYGADTAGDTDGHG